MAPFGLTDEQIQVLYEFSFLWIGMNTILSLAVVSNYIYKSLGNPLSNYQILFIALNITSLVALITDILGIAMNSNITFFMWLTGLMFFFHNTLTDILEYEMLRVILNLFDNLSDTFVSNVQIGAIIVNLVLGWGSVIGPYLYSLGGVPPELGIVSLD
ncbi:hypothetical protein HDV06_001753 [Boothiomyces sp. JEL0866]|nr:hypothetical protein HDV06_001753 [Boothiomyces sp. JEL0866]